MGLGLIRQSQNFGSSISSRLQERTALPGSSLTASCAWVTTITFELAGNTAVAGSLHAEVQQPR